MKHLILVRHAKSDWPENTDDFNRPLADRGLDDAMKMARYLKNNGIQIHKFISSPAVRALNTGKIFNQTYQIEMETDPKLYHASESNFLSVIHSLEDHFNSVALFSHNNGISNFANYISQEIFTFPTCGVAGFEADCSHWSEFESAKKKLVFYYEPKKI